MRFKINRKKRTDAGTIILHWSLAVTLGVSTLTGLRFAIDMPDTAYLGAIAPFLPVARIWIYHIFSGVAVMGLAVAYLFYIRGAGLTRRIGLDRARFSAFFASGQARWAAVNVLLYWLLFGCLATQIVTGLMLHRGYGGEVVEIHLMVTWIILGYVAAHVLAHFALGGATQLMRVLRPSRIPAPAESGTGAAPFSQPSATAGAKILVGSAIAGAIVGAAYLYADRMSRDVLHVARIDKPATVGLSTDLWDSVWRDARPLYIHTNQGVNFEGTGASLVEIRAVHDDDAIYFAFTWEDPTRSLKHAPLIKERDGWRALFTQPDGRTGDETASIAPGPSGEARSNFEPALNEDKFAIMLANVEKPFGPGAFHPGPHPLGDKPPSSSGRGLHYTEDGSSVNLWLWRADGMDSGRCENNRVGPPTRPTSSQARGLSPYKGGYAGARAQQTVFENFTPQLPRSDGITLQPLRLPSDLAATQAAMGPLDLDPNHGDRESARWVMREDESAPFSPDLDARIPVGAIIPGMIAAAPRPPQPSDVRCSARWASGRWTLLARRLLDTRQGDDVVIGGDTFLWVAAFDHTPANHTRHIRPFRLEIQP